MAVQKRQLGADGPMVSAIGFGAMSFGGLFGPTDAEASFAAMDALVETGIDFWDTSNVYGEGVSETVIGDYLAQTGAQVTLATKVGIVRGPTRVFNNAADYIRAELEASLTRLRRDKVELYYIHRREQDRPVEEVAETMGALIDEGLIDGWGLSEVAPSTLRRAHAVRPVRAVQSEYSLWTRLPELGMLQACAELGVAFVPFSPLSRGAMTDHFPDTATMGKPDLRANNPRFAEPNYSANKAKIVEFRKIAAAKGVPTSALALAWVLDQGPHLIPIPGSRTAAHIREWAEADQISLTDQDRQQIAALMPVGWAHGDRYSDAQIIGVERYC